MSKKITITIVILVFAVALGCASSKLLTTEKADSTQHSTGSELTTTLASASGSLKLDDRLAEVRDHCTRADHPGAYWVIKFGQDGERAPYETVLPGTSLELAASAYAIYTLDFDVSVEDLIEEGFWPFYGVIDDLKPDSLLYDFESSRGVASGDDFKPFYKYEVGSEVWLLEVKSMILRRFYRDYYFHSLMTEPRSNMMVDIIPQFWFNPITDSPMVTGENAGDMMVKPLESYRPQMSDPKLKYDFGVFDIVVPLTYGSDSMQTISMAVGNKKASSEEENCCLIQFDRDEWETNHSFTLNYCCPCGLDENDELFFDCCLIQFEAQGEVVRTRWEEVRCVSCDYTPDQGAGEMVIQYGTRAPSTVYTATNGTVLVDVKCDGYECLTLFFEDCDSDRSSFIAQLYAGASSVSHDGPLCLCGGEKDTSRASACCGGNLGS